MCRNNYTLKGEKASVLSFPTRTHKHAADTEARPMHQPVRSLPLPALQSSSYRQVSSSHICNIHTFPVMLQITTGTFRMWGIVIKRNQSQRGKHSNAVRGSPRTLQNPASADGQRVVSAVVTPPSTLLRSLTSCVKDGIIPTPVTGSDLSTTSIQRDQRSTFTWS